MLRSGPPNLAVLMCIDRDVVKGRLVATFVERGECRCSVKYSGNTGDYEYLNHQPVPRTCPAADVFLDTEYPQAKARAER